MKYYSNQYRDAFLVMEKALESDGYVQVSKPAHADVVFIDREPAGNMKKWEAIDNLASVKPVFIYPHTPYSSWLWDGYTKPSKNIACNFVCNESALMVMESYDYPCRVENVGFTRPLTVKNFEWTNGVRLAYSGPRLIGPSGNFYRDGDAEYVKRTMDWIIENKNYFLEIKVFYSFSHEIFGLQDYLRYGCIDFVNVASDSAETKNLNTETALKQLEGVDIFLGSNTLGYIALSQGIPTILIGHNNDVPLHSTNNGIHYADYAKWCDFPINLYDLSGDEIFEYCQEEPEEVTEWKKLNIGESFNAEKFLKIVKEFV